MITNKKFEAKYPYIYPTDTNCDFYKTGHLNQYPEGSELVYSSWTPRNTLVKGIDEVIVFGLQGFIKEYLIDYYNINFFGRPKEKIVKEYVRIIKNTLGVLNPNTDHIERLHDLGYLPIKIKAVKEGTLVPIRVPILTIENTIPEFFWLTNFLETIMSNSIWLPTTSASIGFKYRKIMNHYAVLTGGDIGFVPFQGHDFSMRGMGHPEASKTSGAGHLLSFVGTDTIPAILYHEQFYNADIEKELVGTSIPATEHSVMMAGGRDESAVIKRLITEIYPNGFISIVSDTWDFWNTVNVIYRNLKDEIMNREGRVVIRPDSGNPILIICGDPDSEDETIRKGLIELLWDIFGGTLTDKGFKLLDTHIGAIYGDSITLERSEEILKRLAAKGFASTNIVFGIGSFTYQYQTRDSFGFALKSTFVEINNEEFQIFKDPKTDSGVKKSQKGKVVVLENDGIISFVDELSSEQHENYSEIDLLETVFLNGKLVRNQSLSEIRSILQSNL